MSKLLSQGTAVNYQHNSKDLGKGSATKRLERKAYSHSLLVEIGVVANLKKNKSSNR